MRSSLCALLGLACLVLGVSFALSKRNARVQLEKDAETITSCSNQLALAQTEIAACNATVVTLSNQFETSQSASLTFSNQLVEAQSALAATTEQLNRQITDRNHQITQSESEKQTLSRRIGNLGDQLAGLTNQIISTRASLDQAHKDYVLLENRFRRDVAERVMVERKFNNTLELQAQLEYLKWNPAQEISADSIREGLNVVVKSNLCYVIAPE